MKRERFAWVTVIPTAWLLLCTLTAGWQKVFHSNPKIGFLAHADKFSKSLSEGQILAPAKSLDQMQQIIMNDYIDAGLALMFMSIVISIVYFASRTCYKAWVAHHPTAKEAPFVSVTDINTANA